MGIRYLSAATGRLDDAIAVVKARFCERSWLESRSTSWGIHRQHQQRTNISLEYRSSTDLGFATVGFEIPVSTFRLQVGEGAW